LDPWGERMLAPDEVAAMVQLHKLGWGSKRIAGELGCSRNTVKVSVAPTPPCDW
jgi:DNA-binding NarL/FixJ family response regulator